MSRVYSNYADIITFTRASSGTALRPISYGDELVTNGTFDTDTGWTLGTSAVIGSGYLEQPSGTGSFNYQTVSTTATKVYVVEFEILQGSFYLGVWNTAPTSTTLNTPTTYSTGVHKTYFVAVDSDASISFTCNVGAGRIDNVSVREVLFDQPNAPLTLFNHPTNVPRIEYDADGNRLGLLVEESRTNLLTYSEDFTNASWVNFNADSLIVTADQANGSDGSASLDKIEITDSTSEKHFLYFSNSITQGQNYSISCELKNGDQRYVSLGMYDSGSRWFAAVFDLQNGTVTQESEGGADATIQSSGVVDLGGGLYRCYVVGSIVNGDSSGYTYIQLVSSGTPTFDAQGGETYSAVGGEYFYAGKIQLEAGSFPTSYIPTSGSTVTRSADVASIGVSEFGYNENAGTIYVDGTFRDTETIVTIGSTTIDADADGKKDYTATYSSNPSATAIELNNGLYNSIRYYPRVLTADQLEALTS